MSGYASQKRGGSFDHYSNGRSQKHSRSEHANFAPLGSRNNLHQQDNSRQPRPPYGPPMRNKDMTGETATLELLHRLPDPRECKECKLASAEMESGMIALLDKLQAEELTPDGDRDIMHHARELRRLLCARSKRKEDIRRNPVDAKWPAKGEPVLVPAYIEHKIESAKDLPPLPPITEPSLQEQVFTHYTIHGMRIRGIDSGDALSYDRLEFLGDAYIELIASRLIASRLPHIDVPEQSTFREQLVKNDTLARFSSAYCLPDRLKHAGHMRESKGWNKIIADIFEAYVAAVVLSDPEHGFQTAEEWLTRLWSPQLLDYKVPIIENPKAKDDIQRLVQMKNVKLTYREERPMVQEDGVQKYTIGLYLTGWGYENEWLGTGEGRNKAQAGVYAATDALNRNSEVLRTAAKRKEDMLLQMRAEEVERCSKEQEELRKLADQGDEEAAAKLKEAIEKANAPKARRKLPREDDGDAPTKTSQHKSDDSPPKKAKLNGSSNIAADKSDVTPSKDTKKSTSSWLDDIAAGKIDASSAKEMKKDSSASWLEKEREKKEKREKKSRAQ